MYDLARVGFVVPSDIQRILNIAQMEIKENTLLFLLRKAIGVKSLLDETKDGQPNGISYLEFITLLTRDDEMIEFRNIKKAFEFFDT